MFDFDFVPVDANIGFSVKYTGQDASGGGGRTVTEVLTVTALNTVSDLSFVPADVASVRFGLDGYFGDSATGGLATVATNKAITVNPANAFDIEVGDRLTATYATFE